MPTSQESVSIIQAERTELTEVFQQLSHNLIGEEKNHSSDRSTLQSVTLTPEDRLVRFETGGTLESTDPYEKFEYDYWFNHTVNVSQEGDVTVTETVSFHPAAEQMVFFSVRRNYKKGVEVGEAEVIMVRYDEEENYYMIRQGDTGLVRIPVRDSYGYWEEFNLSEAPNTPTEQDEQFWNDLNKDFLNALLEDVDIKFYQEQASEIIDARLPEGGYEENEIAFMNVYESIAERSDGRSPSFEEIQPLLEFIIKRGEKYPIGHEQTFWVDGRALKLWISRSYGQKYPSIHYAYLGREANVRFEEVGDPPDHVRSIVSYGGEQIQDFQVEGAVRVEAVICKAMAEVKGIVVLQTFRVGGLEAVTKNMLRSRGYEIVGEGIDEMAVYMWRPVTEEID